MGFGFISGGLIVGFEILLIDVLVRYYGLFGVYYFCRILRLEFEANFVW